MRPYGWGLRLVHENRRHSEPYQHVLYRFCCWALQHFSIDHWQDDKITHGAVDCFMMKWNEAFLRWFNDLKFRKPWQSISNHQSPIPIHYRKTMSCMTYTNLTPPMSLFKGHSVNHKGTTCSPEKNDIYCIIVTRRQGKNDGKEGFKSQWISQRFDLSAILFTQQPFCWECFFYFMFMILLQTTSLSLWYNSY